MHARVATSHVLWSSAEMAKFFPRLYRSIGLLSPKREPWLTNGYLCCCMFLDELVQLDHVLYRNVRQAFDEMRRRFIYPSIDGKTHWARV